MDPGSPDLTPSGIEPIDRLIGGFHKGKLHLAYGEGFAKSLLGMRFLIEGLKLGESAVLVTDYSPEDAVRRFARLGYDCLEHIYTGRLIVLECGEANFKQIAKMADLTPVLKELRWLMGESAPDRVVFEPIGRLIVGERGDLPIRARQFTDWTGGIGSTTLLVSGFAEDDKELVRELQQYLQGSFLITTAGQTDRTTGSLTFDSAEMPAVAIEVDQSEGIFLLDRDHQQVKKPIPTTKPLEKPSEDPMAPQAVRVTANASEAERPDGPFGELLNELEELDYIDKAANPPRQAGTVPKRAATPATKQPIGLDDKDEIETAQDPLPVNYSKSKPTSEQEPESSGTQRAQRTGPPRPDNPPRWYDDPPSSESMPKPALAQGQPVIKQRTTAELLRPPSLADTVDVGLDEDEARPLPAEPQPSTRPSQPVTDTVPNPRTFNILAVSADPPCCKRIAKALKDFSVEMADDGVSGLARLISFRPDLVVLDVDLQVLDGFKILEHIRSNLPVPIIVLSDSYLRASDRIQWAELGADYYLPKPFSVTELRHKARQLIARYRGIEEWITGAPASAAKSKRRASDRRGSRGQARQADTAGARHRQGSSSKPMDTEQPSLYQSATTNPSTFTSDPHRAFGDNGHFLPYTEFVKRIEEKVNRAGYDESWFCIVGCRPRHNGTISLSEGEDALFKLVSSLVRQGDILSVNESNDIMIMLEDADAAGGKAFVSRLRGRLVERLLPEPVIWLRQFPMPDQAEA